MILSERKRPEMRNSLSTVVEAEPPATVAGTDVAALSFRDVRQSFMKPDGQTPMAILSDISFDIPRGKFVSIIGPSGCGKSTLVQMAAGLLNPSGGKVFHNGNAVTSVNSQIGFVPQQPQLLPWKTMIENVEFPLLLRNVDSRERRARALEVVAKVDLAGFEDHYPYQLSGGMQKRASIARMLVYRPDTILMDEPFGALDAQTRMVMQHDLQAMLETENSSVLFVTHDITEAVILSGTVVVMSRRPSRILAEISIDLPRPRNVFEPYASPGFSEAYDKVWSEFRNQLKLSGNT
jgi:NitT/TauT family transport system ATP-binding protein